MPSSFALDASDIALVSSVLALVLGGGVIALRSVLQRPERVPVRVRTDDGQR